jgi:hypothetical protein
MTVLALSWPAAFLASVIVAVVGLVLSIATWQIFRTGCAGMNEHSGVTSASTRSLTSDDRSTPALPRDRRELDVSLRERAERRAWHHGTVRFDVALSKDESNR